MNSKWEGQYLLILSNKRNFSTVIFFQKGWGEINYMHVLMFRIYITYRKGKQNHVLLTFPSCLYFNIMKADSEIPCTLVFASDHKVF